MRNRLPRRCDRPCVAPDRRRAAGRTRRSPPPRRGRGRSPDRRRRRSAPADSARAAPRPVVRACHGLRQGRVGPRGDRAGLPPGRDRARRLARGSGETGSARRRGARHDAANRAARPATSTRNEPGRGRAARLPGAHAGRGDGRRVYRVALVPHRHVQGSLRGRPARRVLSGFARSRARRPVRHLPPALLHEHHAVLGAGAALPPARPQRRDQLHRRQRRVDAGPRVQARPPGLGLGAARQRARGPRPGWQGHPPRDGDVAAESGGGGPRARRGRPSLLPLPRHVARAVGRPRGGRLHRRARRRRRARPQRPATPPLRRCRRPPRCLRLGSGRPTSPRGRPHPAREARPRRHARRRPGARRRGERGNRGTARAQTAVRALATRKRASLRHRRAGRTADGGSDTAPGAGRVHARGSPPPPPPVGGDRSRARVVDG